MARVGVQIGHMLMVFIVVISNLYMIRENPIGSRSDVLGVNISVGEWI